MHRRAGEILTGATPASIDSSATPSSDSQRGYSSCICVPVELYGGKSADLRTLSFAVVLSVVGG